MTDIDNARRCLVLAAGTACAGGMLAEINPYALRAGEDDEDKEKETETSAVEDLMREHGIIRRAILVYRESARKLRANPASIDPDALRRTAVLFRGFGEDYHEKMLEESYIFPALKKAGGPAAADVDALIAQHQRGREITDYILAVTGKGAIGTGGAEPLAGVLDSIELMYANHAAREDTIVFPAWKNSLSAHQLDEIGEKFEEIEHQQFGQDGFTDAVTQIGRIEQMLGLADLAQFTAPPPPRT